MTAPRPKVGGNAPWSGEAASGAARILDRSREEIARDCDEAAEHYDLVASGQALNGNEEAARHFRDLAAARRLRARDLRLHS